jgi:TonB-dependent starch-binding outer membrane protein SusC
MKHFVMKYFDSPAASIGMQFSRLILFFSFILVFQAGYAQKESIKITGIVKDSNGEGLPGVSVVVKNSTTATMTDISGAYSISVPNMQSVIVFSCLGYKGTENLALNVNGTTITMSDREETKLEEVVVVGYGTAKRRDLTGSVGRADIESMTKAPVTSFDQALSGRIAGVSVVSGGDQPGATSQITIRGGSISQDNSPLYVIDGFPVENMDMNSINPKDIESMDVLKDASSIAIYGARGANGVIIITTKRGVVSAPKVTYSFSSSFQHDINRPKLMDPYNFVKMQLDLDSAQTPNTNRFYQAYIDTVHGIDLNYYKSVKGYDWLNLILRNGTITNHSLKVAGGTEDTKYSISGSVMNQQGVIINTGMDRYEGRFNLDQKFSKDLKLGVSASVSKGNTYGTNPSSSNGGGVIESAWKYRPISGLKNQDLLNAALDSASYSDGTFSPASYINPLQQAQNEYLRNINVNGAVNAFLEYTFWKKFTFKISGGYKATEARREQFYNSKTAQGNIYKDASGNVTNKNGVNGSYGGSIIQNYLNENLLSYKNEIFRKQVLDAMVGFTYQYSNVNTYQFSSINIPQATEYLQMAGLGGGTATGIVSSKTKNQLYSFLSRVNYTIADRYLFTGTIRGDGSSKFAPGRQWGYFPSGAFAWRFTSESFMEKVQDVLNDGKLRVSYGSVGNNKVSDFAYLSQFGNLQPALGYPFGNTYQNGIQPYFVPNNTITWETTNEIDLGVNLSFFGDRISVDADYYQKKTKNFLISVAIPYMNGYGVGSSTQYQNVGELMNSGYELTLNTVNIKTKDFKWMTNLTFSMNQSQLNELYGGFTSLSSFSTLPGVATNPAPWVANVGAPIAVFYGYKWGGCYQYSDFDKQADGTYVLKTGVPTYSNLVQPGDAKYQDVSGDGVIDSKDITKIGTPLPKCTGGVGNKFTYQNLTLDIFFQWSYGNDILNANTYAFEQTGGYYPNGNQFASYADRWTPTNPSNDIPRLRYNAKTDVDKVARMSSRYIEDASFLRLKTISLSYSLPKNFLKKLKIENILLTASAQNLWTLTNYSGANPEASNFRTTNSSSSPFGGTGNATGGVGYSFVQPSSSYSALTPGYDYTAYPTTITVNFGASITF